MTNLLFNRSYYKRPTQFVLSRLGFAARAAQAT